MGQRVELKALLSGAAIIALGLGGIAVLRFGLDRVRLPAFGGTASVALGWSPEIADLIRYLVVAGWISFFGPWLFLTLGLLRRSDPP